MMNRVMGILRRRWVLAVILVVVWFVTATVLKGVATLELTTTQNSPFTSLLGQFAESLRGNRTTSPAFIYFFNPIRGAVSGFIDLLRALISLPADGNVIPIIGWLGVLAVIGFIVFATSNPRTALLSMALLLGCGMLGMWADTMDTLAMTLSAGALALAIGFPLGVWAGVNDRVLAFLRPGLDLAQILPTLVYLAPLALVFLIGEASATIATVIYGAPICIRITSHAIRNLRQGPIEAASSMGSTKWQLLTKVQLPMAKSTIILGINQTVLAALSFVVVAALIGAPGLGKPIVVALTIRNVGDGVVAGIAVVLLAIMLDRATSAAVIKNEDFLPPHPKAAHYRRIGLICAGAVTLVAVIASRYVLWAAVFPTQLIFKDQVGSLSDSIVGWITSTFAFITTTFNESFTVTIINPLEGMLANAPWYLTIAMLSLLAGIISGLRSAIATACLLGLVVLTGLWSDTMITLTQVLVATVIVMVVGVVFGVVAGRSVNAERVMKPILDAGQTLPAFVYLVPVLALFGPTRFAAIVCGVFYATPVVVRVVADGVRGVPPEMVESAISSGSTSAQVITKVQLPASKKSLMLGANQGLIFVLAVVVIGGFVGAGGLGYLVIVGASKPNLTGKGLAAGIAIVLLGVMLDRIAQAGANRSGNPGN